MYIYSLCKQLCPDKLPAQPLERVGDGADGEVFTIKDCPDRVLKLAVIYDVPSRGIKDFQNVKNVLEYIIVNQPSAYVRIYEYGELGTYSRQIFKSPRRHQKQNFILYYYVMEKLFPITEDEKKVFHSIVSHEDRGIEKKYSSEKISEMIRGMSLGLDFDKEKITLFCQHLHQSQVHHRDIHVRNIMKNVQGDFKLIDVDRSKIT